VAATAKAQTIQMMVIPKYGAFGFLSFLTCGRRWPWSSLFQTLNDICVGELVI
jgi:hypothetical protein